MSIPGTENGDKEEVTLDDFMRNRDPQSFLATLVAVLGKDRASRFVEFFGGLTLEVPEATEVTRIFRDFDVWSSLTSGKSTQGELATKYGLNQGWVSRLYGKIQLEVEDILEKKRVRRDRGKKTEQ